jgi:hypothetical protein
VGLLKDNDSEPDGPANCADTLRTAAALPSPASTSPPTTMTALRVPTPRATAAARSRSECALVNGNRNGFHVHSLMVLSVEPPPTLYDRSRSIPGCWLSRRSPRCAPVEFGARRVELVGCAFYSSGCRDPVKVLLDSTPHLRTRLHRFYGVCDVVRTVAKEDTDQLLGLRQVFPALGLL